MDNDKKLAFIQSMTKQALDHVASTQDQPTPDGKMSHDKKLAFVTQMAKHGLQHFDAGGTTLTAAAPAANTANTVNNNGLVGTIGNALGQNNQFQAAGANIQSGTNLPQLNQSYTGVQNALGSQSDLVNQSQPGVAQGFGAQNTLSQQYANEAAGNGPSPAQSALNQNSGRLIAQQAALAAGQRGAGANAGLIASQNAQQGAATAQQAVGQSATLGAEQQLAAQNAQANLASTQIGQGAGAIQNLNQQQQNEQNILQNANSAYNNANVAMTSNMNNVNAQISAANQNAASKTLAGIASGVSSLAGFAHGGKVKAPHMDDGGMIAPTNLSASTPQSSPRSFVAQWVNSTPASIGSPNIAATSTLPENIEKDNKKEQKPDKKPDMAQADAISQTPFSPSEGMAGESAESASPLLNIDASSIPSAMAMPNTMRAADGGIANSIGSLLPLLALANKGGLMKNGGKVNPMNSKEKAQVSGDSLKNDKIPAMLSQGELVIDRDTMNDSGVMGKMARALAAHIQAKNKGKK